MRLFGNCNASIILYNNVEPTISVHSGKVSVSDLKTAVSFTDGKNEFTFHEVNGRTIVRLVHFNSYTGGIGWVQLFVDLPEDDKDAALAIGELVRTCGEYWPKDEDETTEGEKSKDETTEEEKGE